MLAIRRVIFSDRTSVSSSWTESTSRSVLNMRFVHRRISAPDASSFTELSNKLIMNVLVSLYMSFQHSERPWQVIRYVVVSTMSSSHDGHLRSLYNRLCLIFNHLAVGRLSLIKRVRKCHHFCLAVELHRKPFNCLKIDQVMSQLMDMFPDSWVS